jgi:anti-sigma B factor antagonist
MSFSIKKQGEICVVDVEGQLIVGNRQELKQKVLDELEKGEKKFLIDFSQTGYIDSSGLGVLVSLSKKIREQGGELRLANLNDDLKTLFELTKLDTLFQIADTRERALESFGKCRTAIGGPLPARRRSAAVPGHAAPHSMIHTR